MHASSTISKITLLGTVDGTPRVVLLPNGVWVAKLTLVTSFKKKEANEIWSDMPEFHNIAVMGKLAEYVNSSIHEGQQVYVEGRLRYKEAHQVEIMANHLQKIQENTSATVLPIPALTSPPSLATSSSLVSVTPHPIEVAPTATPLASSKPEVATPLKKSNQFVFNAEDDDIPF